MRTLRIAAVVAVAALALAACGDDSDNGDDDDSGDITTPTGADEVVVQVTQTNSSLPPGSELGNVPYFSLYGDGRVITVGPTTQEFPGPALPNLVEGTISADAIEATLADAAAVGLLDEEAPDFGDLGLVGAGATVITINAGGDEHQTTIVALDAGPDDALTDEQNAARESVRDFVGSLDGDVADTEYEADAVGVFIQSQVESGEEVEQIDWPLGDLATAGEPLAEASDIRCAVFTGDEAQTVLDAAAAARQNATWLSEGEPYTLTFRPLLPNEETCADLEEAGAR